MKIITCFVLCISYSNAGLIPIIPEELPSLLSVAYSNIPPIKKGTDSRVGFGFSLGNHADFQVVFELGPQVDTNPIGMAYPTNTKRHVGKTQKVSQSKTRPQTTDGSSYLNSWSENNKQKRPFEPLPIPGVPQGQDLSPLGTINLQEAIANIDTSQGVIPQPRPANMPKLVLSQLKQLYGEKLEEDTDDVTTSKQKFTQKQKQNTNRPGVHKIQSVKIGTNSDRLTEFHVEDDRISELKKRKVTEELSDVSLDDE